MTASELTDKLGLQSLRNRKVIPVPLYMTASELTEKLGLQSLSNRKVKCTLYTSHISASSPTSWDYSPSGTER